MTEKQMLAELVAAITKAARAPRENDEFMRRFNEEFDDAERRKRENNRRLEARLAELRAQRGSALIP